MRRRRQAAGSRRACSRTWLPPCGREPVRARATRHHDPVVGRQILACEAGTAGDLDEDRSVPLDFEPPIDGEVFPVDDRVGSLLNLNEFHGYPLRRGASAPPGGRRRTGITQPHAMQHDRTSPQWREAPRRGQGKRVVADRAAGVPWCRSASSARECRRLRGEERRRRRGAREGGELPRSAAVRLDRCAQLSPRAHVGVVRVPAGL